MYLTTPTVHKDHIYILARVAEREPRTDDGGKKKRQEILVHKIYSRIS